MWSQYDEDLSQNDFFKEIKESHSDILQRAASEHWIICIPRKGSLKREDISTTIVLDHVLVPLDDSTFNTLNKKLVQLKNHHLYLELSSNSVEILFDETHYNEQSIKYVVWCINSPLFVCPSHRACMNNNVSLIGVQDCIDFLYLESNGHYLLEDIKELCEQFWSKHETVVLETLQNQKESIGKLYSQCLQVCFKKEFVKEKSHQNVEYVDNLKLAIETYMQYCLGKKIVYMVNTLEGVTDSMINKIVRNSSGITLCHLNISQEYNNLVHDATGELSRLNNFVTVLDKVHCLSRVFHVFLNNPSPQKSEPFYLTSDDFLQLLVLLILKSNIPNWATNITYLKEFQFCEIKSEDSFLVSSLEAAVAFIKSTQFLDIKYSIKISNNNENTILFDLLYTKLKETCNLQMIENLLLQQKVSQSKLCHPLCTCTKCIRLDVQKVDCNPQKLLNASNQNFLIFAVMENDRIFVEFLLSLDFDLNLQDINGKSALHYAAEHGFQDILLLLINAKINVNLLDINKNTALHLASDKGHDNCVKALIYSSPCVELNLQNASGETPLFLATRWGYFDIIKLLLENGASVCIKNNRNVTIYKLSPNFYVTKLFREFGKRKSNRILQEVSQGECKKTLGEHDHPSRPPDREHPFAILAKTQAEIKKINLLLKVIEYNDLPLTCFYLGYNNTHSNYDNISKCHPLCTCLNCSKDSQDVSNSNNVKDNDCKFNINMCNKDGYTALHVAAKFGRTEILRVLLDSGASVNVCTYSTLYTPLHLAVIHQRVQAVKELLQCGSCHIDAQDYKGNTPLFYASTGNNLKLVEYLLQNGADCLKRNFQENNVLQECEEKNLFRVCKILRTNLGYVSNADFSEDDFEFL